MIYQMDNEWYYKSCNRTCIIVGGRSYYDLHKIWTRKSFGYLRESFNCSNGLFLYERNYPCPVDLQGVERRNPFCYELMFGDIRAWVRSDTLEKYCSKELDNGS